MLLGVIGFGKIFIIVNVIVDLQWLMMVLVLNKILVVQFYGEMKEFFLENVVEYFVFYYDYYQLEVYVFSLDIFIEKDVLVNEYIEQMCLLVIKVLFEWCDVVVVVLVLVIYGFGDLDLYLKMMLYLMVGMLIDQWVILCCLVELQYICNDQVFQCGIFCVCGEVIDVFLVEFDDIVLCIELFDEEVECLLLFDLFIGYVEGMVLCYIIYFKIYYVMLWECIVQVMEEIKFELVEWCKVLLVNNKLLEEQCLIQCIQFDFEMMNELGYCLGIENYLCFFFGCGFGELLLILFDYLLVDGLLVIDEFYVMVLQIGGMYWGDWVCKEMLVEYGFCLLLVLDNWLMKFEEFEVLVL